MKKLSGLVLDVRDDYDGAVLRSIFPTDGEIPNLVKQAVALTPELEARIPDDLFAVVLHDEDVVLRKFACIDSGNTALSVEYFLKTAHKLPLEAQVVAATNLIAACGWYDIDPPSQLSKIAMQLGPDAMEKISLGLGSMLNLGMTVPGMARQAKMNLEANQGAGHLVVTPTQRKEMLKGAEASGTPPMPNSAPQGAQPPPTKTPVVVKSAGAAGFVGDLGIQGEHHAVTPDDNSGKPTSAETPKRLPQSAPLRPHVSVAGKEAPGQLTLKKAELYALPSQQRYPLDGMDQVKEASAYFDEYRCRMTPEMRREFCVNMVKRARALDLPVSDTAAAYGADGYAEPAHIKIAIDGRRGVILDETMLQVLDKVAEQYVDLSPTTFARLLHEFDKMAGIEHLYDRDILDPYLSTFGEKRAADSIAIGNDFISVRQLKRLASVGFSTVKYRFGDQFAEKFVKDPVGTFNSMPLDQKRIMMRMVSDNGAVDGEITV